MNTLQYEKTYRLLGVSNHPQWSPFSRTDESGYNQFSLSVIQRKLTNSCGLFDVLIGKFVAIIEEK